VEGPLQRVEIVDCTLVPGWGIGGDCSPQRPAEPSLEIYCCPGRVVVKRSIIGSIQVYADEVTSDPTPIELQDSVIDATSRDREAVGAPNWPLAHAAVSFADCTVIGEVATHAIPAAGNTLFPGLRTGGTAPIGLCALLVCSARISNPTQVPLSAGSRERGARRAAGLADVVGGPPG